MGTAIDLSKLPAPDIIETLDYEALLVERKQKYILWFPEEQRAEVASRLELESDPANKMLQESCYRETVIRARYNNEARALLIAFATGTDLDHIGITYYHEPRLLIYAGDPDANPPVVDIYESDDEYRHRLLLKPDSYSVAGPRGAFEFHAMSASGKIKSVGIISPYPGTTAVYVLARDSDRPIEDSAPIVFEGTTVAKVLIESSDGTPDETLISIVDARLDDETIRPLSEEVLVFGTEIKRYTVDLGLIVFKGPGSTITLEESIRAVYQLVKKNHKNDADITFTDLYAEARQPGVKRVIINSPTEEIICDKTQAPFCASIRIEIIGVEA